MDPTSIVLPNSMQNAAVLTIFLAFFGYLVTFIITRMMARRADRLRLVNERLNEFYGPLYVASQAGNIAYRSLLTRMGKTQSYPITDAEMKDWMLWMKTIFMPLNDVREKIIIEKAHLIVEEQMPRCLLDFVTHVVGYKAVLAKWARAITLSAAPPSAGRRSSMSMWSARTKPSKPNRPACCTAPSGSSAAGSRGAKGVRAVERSGRQVGMKRRNLGHRLGEPRLAGAAALALNRRINVLDGLDPVRAGKMLLHHADAFGRQQDHIARLGQRMQRLKRHQVNAVAIYRDKLQAVLAVQPALAFAVCFLASFERLIIGRDGHGQSNRESADACNTCQQRRRKNHGGVHLPD